jgi:hypothetical protein
MAAGQGFKTFATGDVLTAADTNGYLMQGVWVFADAAARSAAVTSPQEGNMSFLKDTNSTEYYSGSAWVAVGGSSSNNTFYAGKNKIINGAFNVWQRGTSFASPASGTYTADRFKFSADGSGSTRTLSQQTFTPGTAPVAGYESQFFFRFAQTVAGTGGSFNVLQQLIEDVRTFAGQTVTISFWAKAAAATSITTGFDRNYGSGGSGSEFGIGAATHTLTTSWVRYTNTVSLASVSGKTIGAGSYLTTSFGMPNNATFTVDIWGVQVEAGSTATDFQTASGYVGSELALCQRYYYRTSKSASGSGEVTGIQASAITGTIVDFGVKNPVTMRIAPTSLETGIPATYLWRTSAFYSSGTFALMSGTSDYSVIRYTHGSSVFTINDVCSFTSASAGTFYYGFNAEL